MLFIYFTIGTLLKGYARTLPAWRCVVASPSDDVFSLDPSARFVDTASADVDLSTQCAVADWARRCGVEFCNCVDAPPRL